MGAIYDMVNGFEKTFTNKDITRNKENEIKYRKPTKIKEGKLCNGFHWGQINRLKKD